MSERAPRVRLAFVIDAVGPWSVGGREVRNAELLSRLDALGVDVTVYSMRWWDAPPVGAVRYVALMPRMSLYRGERRSILQGVLFALGSLRLLVERFDVLAADHMPYLPLFPLRVVAWVRHRRLVVDWHELWGPAYWRAYLGRAGVLAALVERGAVHLGDLVLAGTPALRGELVAAGARPGRVDVVSYAVDRARLELASPARDAPELLCVGRLLAHKRTELAIGALGALRRDGLDVRLGVVGDGPELGSLRALAAELGVRDATTFYGAMGDHDEVFGLLRAARVLVFPSQREGFGLAAAESLALGTPVVCVAGPGNEACALVEDGVTGSVVASPDAELIARAIRTWLDRDAPREEVRDAFWSAHPELDWDASATRYARLIRAMADGRRR